MRPPDVKMVTHWLLLLLLQKTISIKGLNQNQSINYKAETIQGCDFEPGYFLGGNNLREPFEVEDSDGCGLRCARWPKCAFWTFK